MMHRERRQFAVKTKLTKAPKHTSDSNDMSTNSYEYEYIVIYYMEECMKAPGLKV